MKNSLTYVPLLIVLCFATMNFATKIDAANEVPYPEGYRNWTHFKTAIIGPKNPGFKRFGGFHHIYANAKAMEGYKAGGFSDGAVLVADFLEAVEKEDGNVVEGNRRFVDVMVKDCNTYQSTGGWGFEEFKENSATERNIKNLAAKECFNCHASQKQKEYVFSSFRK